MSQSFDASKSVTALSQDSTIIVVVELAQTKWLAAATIPGVEWQPLKKLEPDAAAMLKLLERRPKEAGRTGSG